MLKPKHRKPYHKVRHGCQICKLRKVRCTLERPVCGNCGRLGRGCIYPPPNTTPTISPQQDATLLPLFTCQTPKRVNEMQLIHHYTSHTSSTLSNNPHLTSLWKDVVPRYAFRDENRFLLAGVLAVAGRHRGKLCHEEEDAAGMVDVDVYEQQALSAYIRALDCITPGNCHALFAFSQVILAIPYSRLSCSVASGSGISNEVFISDLCDIFQLLKGPLAIARTAGGWLRDGELGGMLGPGPGSERSRPRCRPFEERNAWCLEGLAALAEYISHPNTHSDKARVQTLLSTITLLTTLFLEDPRSENRLNTVLGLPVFFDPGYIKLVRRGDPAALVVLGWYGVAMEGVEGGGLWYLDGVGGRVVRGVGEVVGKGEGEWEGFLWGVDGEGRDDR